MGEIKNSELFQRLKVYFLDMLQSSATNQLTYFVLPRLLRLLIAGLQCQIPSVSSTYIPSSSSKTK